VQNKIVFPAGGFSITGVRDATGFCNCLLASIDPACNFFAFSSGSQKDASSRVGSLRRRASTGCTSGRLEDVRVFFPPMFFVVFRLSL